MLDSKKTVQAKLATILPTQYELFLDSSTSVPCITYIESGGSSYLNGNSISYTRIGYTVKVWARDVNVITEKAILVDAAMRELGFQLTGSNELVVNAMICKILNYEAVGQEGSAA